MYYTFLLAQLLDIQRQNDLTVTFKMCIGAKHEFQETN